MEVIGERIDSNSEQETRERAALNHTRNDVVEKIELAVNVRVRSREGIERLDGVPDPFWHSSVFKREVDPFLDDRRERRGKIKQGQVWATP